MERLNKLKCHVLELFVLSAISLYFELLIIRWMSTDIRAFTVFRTFPLIACFIGLGVGFALRNDKNYKYSTVSILLFVFIMQAMNFYGISFLGFPSLNIFQWNNLTGLLQIQQYLLLFMLSIVLLLSAPFAVCVCIGARLGELFSKLPPLSAYSWNVGGAVMGSVLFLLLSTLGLAPWQLLLLPTAIISADLILKNRNHKGKYLQLIPLVFIVLICCYFIPSLSNIPLNVDLEKIYCKEKTKTFWSPYQRIDLTLFKDKSEHPQFRGLELSVNHLFYQYFFHTRVNDLIGHGEFIERIREDYSLPFSFNSAKDVLIVGAGTGQNVSAAVDRGALNIDAVDIDPLIIDIGRKYNPDYSKANVHLVCDDARHFISTTKKQYDVINFSTLDSHTVAGLGSSVRLDSYIYTKECIRRALSLLKEDGILHLSFVTEAPWIKERLFKTLMLASGYEPLVLQGKITGTIYLLGPAVQKKALFLPKNYEQISIKEFVHAKALTDDWPYIYVKTDVIDFPYLAILVEIMLIGLYAARKVVFDKNDFSVWHMFFLGAAFMLLELHAISFLSLLYGSTWITSGIVINSILIMLLIANNFVVRCFKKLEYKMPIIYFALLASILCSYLIPTDILLNMSSDHFIVFALLTVVTILPMGIAAIIFSISFAKVSNISKAFAFNLFGAVIGGLLEYLSNWWGIRSLNIIAAGLYLASALCYFAKYKMAEKQAKIL